MLLGTETSIETEPPSLSALVFESHETDVEAEVVPFAVLAPDEFEESEIEQLARTSGAKTNKKGFQFLTCIGQFPFPTLKTYNL
jgi:hypothetical protein